MFCQIAAGSLLLSAIGVLRSVRECLACLEYTILLRQGGQHGFLDLPVAVAFCGAKNRVIESTAQYYFKDSYSECTCPPAAADRPCQWNRHLLRNLRRTQCGADTADHGARRPDDPLGRRF